MQNQLTPSIHLTPLKSPGEVHMEAAGEEAAPTARHHPTCSGSWTTAGVLSKFLGKVEFECRDAK